MLGASGEVLRPLAMTHSGAVAPSQFAAGIRYECAAKLLFDVELVTVAVEPSDPSAILYHQYVWVFVLCAWFAKSDQSGGFVIVPESVGLTVKAIKSRSPAAMDDGRVTA